MSSWSERFLDRGATDAVEAIARLQAANVGAPDERTYAIGDIHGCAALLIALLAAICEAHPEGRSCKLVFLGDLIDRGPDSAKAAAMAHALEGLAPAGGFACLRGNHEQLMIDWLRKGDVLWLANGAFATIDSFEFEGRDDKVLADIVDWMERLPSWREDAQHIYVHAGLRPGVAYDKQSDQDRLWIREEFLDHDHDFGKHVIHGHTPVLNGPDQRPFRTNIDTGAVYGGVLTAAVLDSASPAPIGFLRAARSSGRNERPDTTTKPKRPAPRW